MEKQKRAFRLAKRKERWGLTIWGWLLLLLLFFLLVFYGFCNIYGLLSPTHREKTDILVLEGFISDYVLQEAIEEFRKNNYQLLITTGTPFEYGELLAPYKNTATVAGMSLLKLGFDSTKLVIVSTDEIRNDRTYNSAVALRHWLGKNKPGIKAINLMTMSVHGARSQLLFKAAMGDSIHVGIISLRNFYYGPHSWWKSSKGFRETMNEAIGYFYVRFFFRPGP
ncbi:MAG: YdcF family protein [Bacteroidales bacterium]|jgi:hypothetical protein|nr:YdcF family protein [Bacteroidales bacterium]